MIKRHSLPGALLMQALLLSLCLLFTTACEEERFQVPSKKRVDRGKYKTRMLAAPLAKPPASNKAAGKAPKTIRLRSRFGHQGAISSLAIAPSGQYALTGGARELLHWRLPRGRKLKHTHDLSGAIKHIAFAPTGLSYALLEGKHAISMWSAVQHTLQKRIQSPHALTTMRFAPISSQILALTAQGQLLRFQGATLQQQRQQQVCPKGQAGLAFDVDPLQQWVAVACRSGHVWIGKEGSGGKRWKVGSGKAVTAIAMSPKQPWLAIGTADGKVRLWHFDIKSERATPWSTKQGHFRSVTALRFSADGKMLLSGSADHHVDLWQVQATSPQLKLNKRLRHTGKITSLAWHPVRPKELLVTDDSGYLRGWNTAGTRLLLQEPSPLQGGVVSFSPRADVIATHGDKGFSVWDLRTGKRTTASTVHPHPLLTLSYARDGNHVLAVDRDNAVFWDLHHRRYVDVVNPPKGGEISAASLGREWTEVWFGTPRNGIFLWTIAGKRLLYRHTTPRYVTAVAFHPRTRRAAAATLHGKLYLYDMNHRRLLLSKQISQGAITRLAFSPDGKRLAAISGKSVYQWQWKTINAAPQTTAHKAMLTAMRYQNDGKKLFLGSNDHQIWEWQPGTPIAKSKIKGCRSPIRALDISLRRPLIAVACRDASIHISHTRSHKRISSHIPLPGKEWMSWNPQHDFVSSAIAFRHFVFVHQSKELPLQAFQSHFFAPKRLKGYLQQAIR